MTVATSSTTDTPLKSTQGRVLVLDFGSQYAQLIARRVREQHVYCKLCGTTSPPNRFASITRAD